MSDFDEADRALEALRGEMMRASSDLAEAVDLLRRAVRLIAVKELVGQIDVFLARVDPR